MNEPDFMTLRQRAVTHRKRWRLLLTGDVRFRVGEPIEQVVEQVMFMLDFQKRPLYGVAPVW